MAAHTLSQSSNISRRAVLTGVTAVAAIGAPATSALAICDGHDAIIFELVQRYRDQDEKESRLWDQRDEFPSYLGSPMWTPEELKRHNMQHLLSQGVDRPQYVDQEAIETANWRDDPRHRYDPSKSGYFETVEGTLRIHTIMSVYETAASPQEIASWEKRCEARRALYDSKQEARATAKLDPRIVEIDHSIAQAREISEGLKNEIAAFQPTTISGALEKLRFYREYEAEVFDDPEELPWSARLFLSALADLERLSTERFT